MYRKVLIVILLCGVFSVCTTSSLAQTYGLEFNGHNVTSDRRTELNLTTDGFLKFQDELEVSFDYKTTRIHPSSNDGFFGYIFRIVNKEDENIDLLSTPTPTIGLNLVVGKSNSIIPVLYPESSVNKWIRLRIKLLLSEDRLVFYTPDTFYVHENLGFKKTESLKIFFGANDYKQFKNSDVPSMIIKDIQIFEKGILKYNWPLNEKGGDVAVDRKEGLQAQVINPLWLRKNHENWQLQLLDEVKGAVLVTADLEGGKVFMLGQNEITIYDGSRNNISKHKYVNEPLFFNENFRAIYNNTEDKIYCYKISEALLYILDLKTLEWNERGTETSFDANYRHHNAIYDSLRNRIYLFGGYGFHRYKNAIWKIDIENKTWDQLPTNDSVYDPRYLSGIDALNDTVYLLGGYGNETGNQLINPHSYFDLIGYSIKDSSLFKKFEIPKLIDDMVVGNTMWINKKNRDYYALIFSKMKFEGELQLIKGNLDSPEVEEVGDKIPFKFLDVRSTVNLYYLPNQDKLYTCMSYRTDSTTKVTIYSIDNPPNKSQAIVFAQGKTNKLIFYIIIVFALLSILIVWKVFRTRKDKSTLDDTMDTQDSVQDIDDARVFVEPVQELQKYNLIFFGGFQVFNKGFEDITNKFSPLLKELFLLILLHTYKNNKGISTDKITEILWYDKSEKSARNNRAVNIAKLRSILEDVGSCQLSKKTGYWKIDFEDAKFKSDYVDFLNITASKNNLNEKNVTHLINITQKGSFLSNVHYEWLDDFKARVSDTIVDTLVGYIQSRNVKSEADFIIHVADSIFNFDVINEEAMILKCKAQYCMGKHSHAKATYEKFFKEYFAMYGQEYEKAFRDIMKIE